MQIFQDRLQLQYPASEVFYHPRFVALGMARSVFARFLSW
jgi:hypothetical protein